MTPSAFRLVFYMLRFHCVILSAAGYHLLGKWFDLLLSALMSSLQTKQMNKLELFLLFSSIPPSWHHFCCSYLFLCEEHWYYSKWDCEYFTLPPQWIDFFLTLIFSKWYWSVPCLNVVGSCLDLRTRGSDLVVFVTAATPKEVEMHIL